VFIGGIIKHLMIYMLVSWPLAALARPFEKWFGRRVEAMRFADRGAYKWFTDPGRGSIVHNAGFVVSRAALSVFYGYTFARLVVFTGRRLLDIPMGLLLWSAPEIFNLAKGTIGSVLRVFAPGKEPPAQQRPPRGGGMTKDDVWDRAVRIMELQGEDGAARPGAVVVSDLVEFARGLIADGLAAQVDIIRQAIERENQRLLDEFNKALGIVSGKAIKEELALSANGQDKVSVGMDRASIYLWNRNTASGTAENMGKFVMLTSVENARDIAKKLIPYVQNGQIASVKFQYNPKAYGLDDTAFLVYCKSEDPEVRTALESLGCEIEGWKPDSESLMEGALRRELNRLSKIKISDAEKADLMSKYADKQLTQLIVGRKCLPKTLDTDYQAGLLLDLLDPARTQKSEPFRQRLAKYHLNLYPDAALLIRLLVDTQMEKTEARAVRVMDRIEEDLKFQKLTNDILRETAFAESAGALSYPLTPSTSLRASPALSPFGGEGEVA
jgi:hypothetical protein